MSGEVVPFGKYKGQPVETLVTDTDYCEWLVAQPWFSAKYRNVYNVVINYGAEPQDSPEHNQMQARFLDDEWCFALADLLHPKRKDTYGSAAARAELERDPIYQKFRQCVEIDPAPADTIGRSFENHGWDVIYGVNPASIDTHRTSLVPPLPACICECDHDYCPGGKWSMKSKKRGIGRSDHCVLGCYWRDGGNLTEAERTWLERPDHCYQPPYEGLIRVELKPDLGDDYPSVLRQVKGYPRDYGDKRCVIVRRHAFQYVTWEQVQKIFAAEQILLLGEQEIAAAPWHDTPSLSPIALVEDRLGGEVIAEIES